MSIGMFLIGLNIFPTCRCIYVFTRACTCIHSMEERPILSCTKLMSVIFMKWYVGPLKINSQQYLYWVSQPSPLLFWSWVRHMISFCASSCTQHPYYHQQTVLKSQHSLWTAWGIKFSIIRFFFSHANCQAMSAANTFKAGPGWTNSEASPPSYIVVNVLYYNNNIMSNFITISSHVKVNKRRSTYHVYYCERSSG